MSLRRRLAQLLVLRASGYGLDHQRRYPRWELSNSELRRWLSEGVGGVILLGGSAADLALRCRQLQEWASEPLLLCADVEEGVGIVPTSENEESDEEVVINVRLGLVHARRQ